MLKRNLTTLTMLTVLMSSSAVMADNGGWQQGVQSVIQGGQQIQQGVQTQGQQYQQNL